MTSSFDREDEVVGVLGQPLEPCQPRGERHPRAPKRLRQRGQNLQQIPPQPGGPRDGWIPYALAIERLRRTTAAALKGVRPPGRSSCRRCPSLRTSAYTGSLAAVVILLLQLILHRILLVTARAEGSQRRDLAMADKIPQDQISFKSRRELKTKGARRK